MDYKDYTIEKLEVLANEYLIAKDHKKYLEIKTEVFQRKISGPKKDTYRTQFRAVNPSTGEIELWDGPLIKMTSMEEAAEWCAKNKPYLEVSGQVLEIIPTLGDTLEPDWQNSITFD